MLEINERSTEDQAEAAVLSDGTGAQEVVEEGLAIQEPPNTVQAQLAGDVVLGYETAQVFIEPVDSPGNHPEPSTFKPGELALMQDETSSQAPTDESGPPQDHQPDEPPQTPPLPSQGGGKGGPPEGPELPAAAGDEPDPEGEDARRAGHPGFGEAPQEQASDSVDISSHDPTRNRMLQDNRRHEVKVERNLQSGTVDASLPNGFLYAQKSDEEPGLVTIESIRVPSIIQGEGTATRLVCAFGQQCAASDDINTIEAHVVHPGALKACANAFGESNIQYVDYERGLIEDDDPTTMTTEKAIEHINTLNAMVNDYKAGHHGYYPPHVKLAMSIRIDLTEPDVVAALEDRTNEIEGDRMDAINKETTPESEDDVDGHVFTTSLPYGYAEVVLDERKATLNYFQVPGEIEGRGTDSRLVTATAIECMDRGMESFQGSAVVPSSLAVQAKVFGAENLQFFEDVARTIPLGSYEGAMAFMQEKEAEVRELAAAGRDDLADAVENYVEFVADLTDPATVAHLRESAERYNVPIPEELSSARQAVSPPETVESTEIAPQALQATLSSALLESPRGFSGDGFYIFPTVDRERVRVTSYGTSVGISHQGAQANESMHRTLLEQGKGIVTADFTCNEGEIDNGRPVREYAYMVARLEEFNPATGWYGEDFAAMLGVAPEDIYQVVDDLVAADTPISLAEVQRQLGREDIPLDQPMLVATTRWRDGTRRVELLRGTNIPEAHRRRLESLGREITTA